MFRCFKSKKRAEWQWVQNPSQSNVDNINNVRREDDRHFRGGKERRPIWKLKLRNLKLTVRSKISGTCIGASVTFRRVTTLELIQ